MREIKFRAWDKSSNRMYYDNPIIRGFHCLKPEESIAPMQYTGLNDKNGKEIYEGDLISRLRHEEESNWGSKLVHKPEYTIRVVFNEGCFCDADTGQPLGNILKSIVTHKIEYEVIGNIYENPELIK